MQEACGELRQHQLSPTNSSQMQPPSHQPESHPLTDPEGIETLAATGGMGVAGVDRRFYLPGSGEDEDGGILDETPQLVHAHHQQQIILPQLQLSSEQQQQLQMQLQQMQSLQQVG
jgi:hypothetical protein